MKGKQFLVLSVNGKMRSNRNGTTGEKLGSVLPHCRRRSREKREPMVPFLFVSLVVWLRRVQCCKTANNPLTKWHLYAITNNWWLVEAQSLANLIRIKNVIGDVSRGLWLVLLIDDCKAIFSCRFRYIVIDENVWMLVTQESFVNKLYLLLWKERRNFINTMTRHDYHGYC